MPSSSAYAAPIDLDLSPGDWERGGRVVAGLMALGGLALADLPWLLQILGTALVALILVRDHAVSARRPASMRLYADGSVECPVRCTSTLARAPQPSRASASPQPGDERMQPATLLQATTFLGLPQLRWADAGDGRYAGILYPDRLDTDARHRLRVWLATHRPEIPAGAIPARSAPQ